MGPLVSIVMPVYNAGKYLTQALDSLRKQTYPNFEVICVDDGSTDNSVDILKEYASFDKRFQYIQQKNQYAGVARNHGMEQAAGKYIMFLDSDDVFERKMLSVLVHAAEKNHTDIVFFGFFHFQNDIRKRSMMGIPFSDKKVCSPRDHRQDIFSIAQGVPWNKFYRREFVIGTGLQFQSLQSSNDVFFSKTIVVEAERLLFLNRRFVNYRISNANSLQGSYKLASGNFAKCIWAMYDALQSRGKYEFYKESFESYVMDSFMLTLNKCRDLEGFETVCKFIKESFARMNITMQAPAAQPVEKIFEKIMQEENKQALFYYNQYMREFWAPKNSIEYRVGKKMLSSFRIKNYE